MSMLVLNLLLDWLDAIGAATALVALVHPQLRARRKLIPAWVAACLPEWAARLLFGRSSELERFIATVRACNAKKPSAARRSVPLLEDGRR